MEHKNQYFAMCNILILGLLAWIFLIFLHLVIVIKDTDWFSFINKNTHWHYIITKDTHWLNKYFQLLCLHLAFSLE